MTTPPRQAQPETAHFLRKLSPELIDMIMRYCSYPYMRSPSSHPLTPGRNVHTISLSLVCHGLSYATARHIWRIVVLRSDKHMTSVRTAIETSGGRYGRVGSAIRAIHVPCTRVRRIQEYVSLAASCEKLLRLEAPLLEFAPMAAADFHRLQTLALFGSDRKERFKTTALMGLTGLKYLSVGTRLQMSARCPKPMFSLISLSWEGDYQPRAVQWTLQNSPALQTLMLHAPLMDFLENCLTQHGKNILSLRLQLQGSISYTLSSRLFDMIRIRCPNIIELLLDKCPEPRLLPQLPPSLKHLALKPSSDTVLFKGNAFLSWVDSRADLLRVTLWGSHIEYLVGKIEDRNGLSRNGTMEARVKKTEKWKKNTRLEFITQAGWPFADMLHEDNISVIVPDHRCR